MINEARLLERLEVLAGITESERPYSRVAFSELYFAGREYLRQEMESAGLTVSIDAAGNLCGRLVRGNDGVVATGSHSDTVVSGGRYDGVLGVLAGLEAVQSLAESGQTLTHDLEIIDFLAEEVSPFGVSCVGSRGLTGNLDAEILSHTDTRGETLGDAIRRAGGAPERLGGSPLRANLRAFVELHIEQGPVLLANQRTVGIVSGIVGITRHRLDFAGQAAHAGTTPMELRRDALAAAAELIIATESNAQATTGLVATVGEIHVHPNQTNVIPAQVKVTLEIRAERAEDGEAAWSAIMAAANRAAERRNVAVHSQLLTPGHPIGLDQEVMEILEECANQLGLQPMILASGAGHDSAYMAEVFPTGMLFVPSQDGLSHNPAEFTADTDVLAGTKVLCHSLRALATK